MRDAAAEILKQIEPSNQNKSRRSSKRKRAIKTGGKAEQVDGSSTVFNQLYQRYDKAKTGLEQCAVTYLLKNRGQLPDNDEDPEQFVLRRRKVEIKVEKLQQELEARVPKGRDLTGKSWLDTPTVATTSVPKDNAEMRRWQDILLTDSSRVPFPLNFETNEALVWSRNDKGRICVSFPGLSKLHFEIYCDKRQLHWFERFLEDQKTKRASKGQHSSALFTLRSAHLVWREGEQKGVPWDVHRLTLHCTVDHRLWSAEGTEQVRQKKSTDIAQKVDYMGTKPGLSETQEGYLKRLCSSLTRIRGSYNRPSRPQHPTYPHVGVGVSLGLDTPVTVVVYDTQTNEVLDFFNFKQLLGKHYRLFQRRRQQQQRMAHQRHKAQERSAPCNFGESELGQYIDRLLAKAIVSIAQTYRAATIAVPDLKYIRSILDTEVQARAEQKHPGCIDVQKRYAKQYRAAVHRWSYARLIEAVRSRADKVNIALEPGKQPLQGSDKDKAIAVVTSAYHARVNA